ncbi:MAG TPA: FixH family protein [Methylophilus sp.]|nr:FixH family protein [Methylophilus sp.]HQQ33244.1 FixH family protein [Methylophilus sp.]
MDKAIKTAWWKKWHIWLIVGGPLMVVIASFYTLYLAIKTPDPAIDDYYRKGLEINKTLDAQRDNMAPAQQARNHAATGIAASKTD